MRSSYFFFTKSIHYKTLSVFCSDSDIEQDFETDFAADESVEESNDGGSTKSSAKSGGWWFNFEAPKDGSSSKSSAKVGGSEKALRGLVQVLEKTGDNLKQVLEGPSVLKQVLKGHLPLDLQPFRILLAIQFHQAFTARETQNIRKLNELTAQQRKLQQMVNNKSHVS